MAVIGGLLSLPRALSINILYWPEAQPLTGLPTVIRAQ
jgi:hypothetical protein